MADVERRIALPFSGFSDEIEVQVEIQQCQRRLVSREDAGNHAFIHRLVTEEDLDSLDLGLVDLPAANFLIAIAPGEDGRSGSVCQSLLPTQPLSDRGQT